MPNRIDKSDLTDMDIVDAYELGSDGTAVYVTTTVVSTTTGTNVVVIDLASDGEGILYSADHPAESGDLVSLTGTSGGAADGTFTIDTVLSDTSFSTVEAIASSTGGSVDFIYRAGALRVGTDTSGFTNSSATDLQTALSDLDGALVNEDQHAQLRQLIHLADGQGGPFEGFASSYREILPEGDPFPTSVIWWTDANKTEKIVEKTITRSSAQMPTVIEWKVYDTDGTSVLGTATDTIEYVNNVFETSRTRVYA